MAGSGASLPPAKPRPRLRRRNVVIGNKRTTVMMEIQMWDALAEICRICNKDMNAICHEVSVRRELSQNFTSDLRIFILEFFRKRAGIGRPEEGPAKC